MVAYSVCTSNWHFLHCLAVAIDEVAFKIPVRGSQLGMTVCAGEFSSHHSMVYLYMCVGVYACGCDVYLYMYVYACACEC